MYKLFLMTAEYCNKVYGSALYIEGSDIEVYDFDGADAIEAFECPNCGEPIYFEDWPDGLENWLVCPICEEEFKND